MRFLLLVIKIYQFKDFSIAFSINMTSLGALIWGAGRLFNSVASRGGRLFEAGEALIRGGGAFKRQDMVKAIKLNYLEIKRVISHLFLTWPRPEKVWKVGESYELYLFLVL